MFEAHCNLGAALFSTARVDEAISIYQHALALRPDSVEAQSNLGAALCSEKQLDEGITAYRKAIALRPEFAEAHHNLVAGTSAERPIRRGMREYEWRWRWKRLLHAVTAFRETGVGWLATDGTKDPYPRGTGIRRHHPIRPLSSAARPPWRAA